MNRGNHENHDINRKPAEAGGGFYDEVCVCVCVCSKAVVKQ